MLYQLSLFPREHVVNAALSMHLVTRTKPMRGTLPSPFYSSVLVLKSSWEPAIPMSPWDPKDHPPGQGNCKG